MLKQSEETKLAIIAKDVEYIRDSVKKIDRRLEKDYVTRQEFEPIKKISYGLISVVGVAVIGALLSLILVR